MGFYEFNQNNSGGSFNVNKKVCHRVYVEADSAEEANEIAESLGCYFDGCNQGIDCSCCGDRWHRTWENDLPLNLKSLSKSYNIEFETIEDYAQHLANKYGWTNPDARIFYKNGDIREVYCQSGRVSIR